MNRQELMETLDRLAAHPDETAASLLALLEERHGSAPFVHRYLVRRPDVAVPQELSSEAVFSETKVLGPKLNELVASAVAAALRCDFCMHAHIERALDLGATTDEILQALLVAGAICQSSSFAHSFRVLERIEDRRKSNPAPSR